MKSLSGNDLNVTGSLYTANSYWSLL